MVCTPAGVLAAKESHAQIVVKFAEIGFEFGIGEPVDDAAIFHHVVAIRNRRSEAKILLDQEDGETLLLEHADGLADLLDDDRGKTLGRLIEEKEPRARAQDAADGEHLLLAAGKLRALAREALLEIGKELENATEFEPTGPHLGWQQKIFLDVEAGKNSAFLRTQRNAEPRDPVAGQTDELSALIAHRPGALADDAHDRFQRRGLAGAVATKQRHHFAGQNLEGGAMKHMGFAVPGLQSLDRQERRDARTKHDRPRDRPRARAGGPKPSCSRLRRALGRA